MWLSMKLNDIQEVEANIAVEAMWRGHYHKELNPEEKPHCSPDNHLRHNEDFPFQI